MTLDYEPEDENDRFQKVFGKRNFLQTRERPDFLQKADHIIHDQPDDKVTLKALVFELFMKADKDASINFPATMMAALSITAAPYLLRFALMKMAAESGELEEEDMEAPAMFENEWQRMTEALMIFPFFMLTMTNLMLFQTLKVYLKRRAQMKQMLMCMLEPELADTYEFEALPSLELDEENLTKFFKVYKFVRGFNKKFFQRSGVYNILLALFNLVQTIYLWASVIIGGMEITPKLYEFTLVAFLNTTVVVYIVNLGITAGSEANEADIECKNMVWKYRQELAEIADEIELGNLYTFKSAAKIKVKDVAAEGDDPLDASTATRRHATLKRRIEKRGTSVFWLEDHGDALVDLQSKQVYAQKDMFEPVVMEQFAERREKIEAVLERAGDYLENAIEYDRYAIFGFDLNDEFSFELVAYYGALILTFVENVFFGD